MNVRPKFLFSASIALSLLGPITSSHATSMGTERVRTAGGKNNIVKLSVVAGNTALPRSQQVANTLRSQITATDQSLLVSANGRREWPTVQNVMTHGLKVQDPNIAGLKHIAERIEISPVKQGQPALITPHEAATIAERISRETGEMEREATRLHVKAEITDSDFARAKTFIGSWRTVATKFDATSKVLAEHKIAVNLNE